MFVPRRRAGAFTPLSRLQACDGVEIPERRMAGDGADQEERAGHGHSDSVTTTTSSIRPVGDGAPAIEETTRGTT